MNPYQEVGSCAGDEAKGIISRLHVLPEMDVGVVEDVRVQIEIVEALRREHHAHVITAVKERQGLQEELFAGNLQTMSRVSCFPCKRKLQSQQKSEPFLAAL